MNDGIAARRVSNYNCSIHAIVESHAGVLLGLSLCVLN
jgi:hypothetical protein